MPTPRNRPGADRSEPSALSIQIPPRLDDLLGESQLAAAVRLSVRDFEPWIGDSTKGLFFFPEYTDHGPRHISAVLAAAEALVREEAWPQLTAEDAAVLVLAVLLHDAAMHLSADGLLELLDPVRAARRPLLTPLDEKSWPQLFDDFFAEARRWDQRTLFRILGDRDRRPEEEADLYTWVRRPGEMPDPDEWSVRYRKFLGEFVRRHHARMAHEFALHGVPGPGPDRLVLQEVPREYADLAGLVARSHNLHLRETFPSLQKKYSQRVTCRKSHPVFLMALLRIADYLQIDSSRANATLLRVQRLRSPISREEWDAHLAVHDLAPDEQDAESVFVHALPKAAAEFLKLRRLLAGLQAELDTSWAVLGEVYSRQGDLAALGLTLRRVRSNLDDPEKFLADQEPEYFPLHAAFDTVGADLLKLLIGPLYGQKPEVGVRELLQNALDAVHELRQHARDMGDPEMRRTPLPDQEADVLISVDRDDAGQEWLTVSDKGIGMSPETVRDYFLKAGASFRQSDAWRRSFEVNGKSRVLRSGRFGIGALAAFLLGDRIEVSTRHVAARPEDAIRFEASIDDSAIELQREKRDAVGTTVRVRLSAEAVVRLRSDDRRWEDDWDWYGFDEPRVERRFHGTRLRQQYHLPAGTDPGKIPPDWRLVTPEGFQAVHWSYSKAPTLTCNGILVGSARFPDFSQWIPTPKLSVLDRDGRLPLSLTRDRLVEPLSFGGAVLRDVLSDLCACFLVHSPRGPQLSKISIIQHQDPFSPAGLLFTPEGIAPCFTWNLRKCALPRAFILALSSDEAGAEHFELGNLPPVPVDAALTFASYPWHQNREHFKFGGAPFRLWVRERVREEWKLIAKGGMPDRGDDWLRTTLEQVKQQRTIFRDLRAIAEVGLSSAIAIPAAEADVDRILAEILDQPVIPFDPEERLRKLPRAFERLRDHIEVWRSPSLTGWRKDMVKALNPEPP